jgi:putative hemolysin
MDNLMHKTLLMFIFTLTACAADRNAPRPPVTGLANPAAEYCLQKGGERVPVQSPQGVRTECKLPTGEVVDEWELWRHDHPQ